MSPRVRSLLVFILKVAVAAGLIGWLVRSGSLDFKALGILFERPELFVLNLAAFATGIIVASLRWRALLAIVEVRVPYLRLVQLQLTAVFFNVVIPGNVGGDVVKALYVARDQPAEKRTPILLIVFVERLLGLAGLILMVTLVTAARAPKLWADPLMRPFVLAIGLLGLGLVIGPIAFVIFMRLAGPRLSVWTSGPSAVSKMLNKLVSAMRLFSSGPKNLAFATLLSMAAHGVAMLLFWMVARAITNQDIAYSTIATIFPLGMLTLILPISPAGLGVGHVAFDRLFAAIGIAGGATIFNVYLLGQFAPCLLGVIPYLMLKRTLPKVDEAEPQATPRAQL